VQAAHLDDSLAVLVDAGQRRPEARGARHEAGIIQQRIDRTSRKVHVVHTG
jgi:hypothetical protein